MHAWPKDPKTSVVRNGSRLNEILIIRLDPAELDEQTRARAVDGIVAYSAICSHAGCPVTAWVKGDVGDKEVFKCMCHNSEYDPARARRSCSGRRRDGSRHCRWRWLTARSAWPATSSER